MIKTNKYYSKNSKKLPYFVYNAAFKCSECLGQPVYFKDDACPYPACVGRRHNLDATRAIGVTILEYLDENFSGGEISISDIDDKQREELKSLILDMAKRYKNKRKLNDEDLDELIGHYVEQYCLGYSDSQKIRRILVDGLFGYNSYKFEFDNNDNLAIILGTNGLGKTTMFRLLEAIVIRPDSEKLMRERLNFLFELPFRQFRVDFYDGSSIKLIKEEVIKISYEHRAGQGGFDGVYDVCLDGTDLKEFSRHFDNIYSLFSRINDDNKFLFIKVNRVNDLDSLKNNLYRMLNSNRATIKNHFDEIFDSACFPSLVLDFGQKLEECMQNLLFEQAKCLNLNGELVLFGGNKEKYERFFEVFGFNKLVGDIREEEVVDIDEYGKYEDFNDCVEACFEFVKKYQLFKQNFASFYNDFDPGKKEIVYRGRSLCLSVNGKELSFSKLSSGELNLAALIYNLVFNAEDGSIVLVDEPEVSLHIAWQQRIADLVLDLIRDKSDMQVIIATHSPFVSSGHSELIYEGYYLEDSDLK